ncbi:GTP-binding protein [Candidatus Harpocratesius sp.]
MNDTEMFDNLITQLMAEITEIQASAIVDRDGLIIYSKLRNTQAEDDAIGAVTAVFDSFIARIKTDLGSAKEFVTILSVDQNKMLFVSAGNEAIFTVLADKSVKDNKLKVYGEHLANKIRLILEGDKVDLEIPPIIHILANLQRNEFPVGNFSAKIIVLGDPMVGKTSLIRRFVDNKFAESYISTIGVDILRKSISFSEESSVVLSIWDIGGQEKNLTPYRKRFYQGADHAFIAFDISRRKTFESIDHWLEDMQSSLDRRVFITLIATKMDLENQEITIEEIQKKADELGCPYILTSAKTGSNVYDAFQYASYKFIERF